MGEGEEDEQPAAARLTPSITAAPTQALSDGSFVALQKGQRRSHAFT
jgi:hypothetical protein